ELYSPGMIFPGLFGAIALTLAFTSMGSLPISWAGFIFLGLSFLLFAAELQTPGLGVLGAMGVAAFILGSLMLYRPVSAVSPALPEVQVSPWLIGVMTGLVAGFFAFVVRAILK